MDSSSSADPKTLVMRQIQQEAALQNARALVDVSHIGFLFSRLMRIQLHLLQIQLH
jgi:mitochondrial import inner membrane translocase subunit TIM13